MYFIRFYFYEVQKQATLSPVVKLECLSPLHGVFSGRRHEDTFWLNEMFHILIGVVVTLDVGNCPKRFIMAEIFFIMSQKKNAKERYQQQNKPL